jgi:hypothetical protein
VKSATILAMLLVLALTSVAVGQQAATKPEPGMYVDQNGTLLKLAPAPYSGSKTTNSIVKADIFWTFRGGEATVRLSAKRPHFVIYSTKPTWATTQLVIVKLDKKSDHRELRMASGSMFGGHGGFDEKKTVTVSITKRDGESWDALPDKDLEPGEYLLTTEVNPRGFDFGIQVEQAK